MYEIHIKLRNVITGEEANYRMPLKYKSRKEAAIDVFRYAEEISSKYREQKKNSQYQRWRQSNENPFSIP